MTWRKPQKVWQWLLLLSPAALAMLAASTFNAAGWPGNPRVEGGRLFNDSLAYSGVLAAASFALAIWLTRGLGLTLPRFEKTIGLSLMICFVNLLISFAGCAVVGITTATLK